MLNDPVVNEKFEYNHGYEWQRRSQVSTHVFQDQGVDIVLSQKKGDLKHSVWCYSEPGYRLFAGLSKYLATLEGMPDLKEIQHLKGQQFQHEWNSTHFSEMSLMSIIEQDVPREPSTDLVVGAYMGGLIYCGHCRDEEFVISTFHGRTGFEEEVTLNPDDALRVLKSIYYYSGNKDFLDRVYVVARTVNATLRPQEGY